eukprot:TRINITY_DN20146_c0_g1_i1.p1 TRINITY_DN20146_c0_g1~~TRINITY_DN20146_c0_g1_i1.p1  ORF type:complete len:395 (-),score=112.31 TRINITY_DN20146_c0_g1_i1:542-1726(-)
MVNGRQRGQVLLRGLDGRTQCLQFKARQLSVVELKVRLQEIHGIPTSCQRIVTGTRELHNDSILHASENGLFPFCTLLLRLVGGKGGFGSLLRGAGQNVKKTSNFDACRDMSGRRLRHVNAEKKLKEWKEDMKEKGLEKKGADYLKEVAKKAQKQKTLEEAEKVRQECREAAERVSSAVEDAFQVIKKSEAGKRKGVLITEELTAKRSRLWDPVNADESEDDEDDDMQFSEAAGPSTAPEKNDGASSSKDGEGGKVHAIGEEIETAAVLEEVHIQDSAIALVKNNFASLSKAGEEGNEADPIQDTEIASQPVDISSEKNVGQIVCPSLDFSAYATAEKMQELGMDKLKDELMARGLKCGGSLSERAARLFLLKNIPMEKLDKKHFAKVSDARRR